jgi:hypothetical protein
MTNSSTYRKKTLSSRGCRRSLGNLLLAFGLLVLAASLLVRVKIILAAELQTNHTFLTVSATPQLFLPIIPAEEQVLSDPIPPEPNNEMQAPGVFDPLLNIEPPPIGMPSLTLDKPPKVSMQSEIHPLFFPVVLARKPKKKWNNQTRTRNEI